MAKTKGKILSALTDPQHDIPLTQRFVLERKEDVSGMSGTGIVAVGIVLPSGMVVMEWVSFEKSMGIYHSIAQLEKVHGHEGRTLVRFIE
jgi:hypothetical protein